MKILRLMFLIFTLMSMNIICLTVTTFCSGPANLLNLREPYARLSRNFLKRKFVLVTQRCLMINAVLPSRDCNTIISSQEASLYPLRMRLLLHQQQLESMRQQHQVLINKHQNSVDSASTR